MTEQDSSAIVFSHFPQFDARQRAAIDALGALYAEHNSRINVVSRADLGNLYERHVLHSLAIAAFLGPLRPGTRFMDLGTGGGFPAIPLAIAYPECTFFGIDRIGKKIRVASEIAAAVGLDNIKFFHGDSSECHERFDYVVSRAVMPLAGLLKACSRNILRGVEAPGAVPPGLVCLKGGDLAEEIAEARRQALVVPVSDYFDESFFDTKSIVYVNLSK
ncbi:MAG: 16S rRNA (guanine(527)-N(7))-methyltransferase RsmG [Muribaculaceae bacterium]|nr:16S rRNA (guanine(527)-N(7))-methyltransferase RsmG [Muribaculaceae bacterium]